MIHGAGGDGWEYDKWRPVFEKAGWNVVAKDLIPVHGKYESTQFDDYVDQVQSWTPPSRKLIYVGASMGGILALKAQEKRAANAVVLIDSVGPAGIGNRKPAPLNPLVVQWANGPEKDTEDAMPDSDIKTILWAWKRWRNESGTVMNQIHEGIQAQKPQCPVLVVLGEADTDVPHATGLSLAKWANGEVKSYPRMSHVDPLMSRRATEVAQYTVNWLSKKVR
jgi:hypothetical protein